MQRKESFWRRSFHKMKIKYLGWDWRVIPLLGFISFIVSAIWLREHLWIAFCLGYAALLILCVCWSFAVHDVWKEDKVTFEKRIETVKTLEQFRQDQEGHEQFWLRPVIEWIDLTKDEQHPNQVRLKYQIDSALLYDFKPYRMWLKLRIGQCEPKDACEVLETPNLRKGRRSQFSTEIFTVGDDDLLKLIEKCRQGLQIAQTLKVIVQLRQGEELKNLEPSYSINPYSEFTEVKP